MYSFAVIWMGLRVTVLSSSQLNIPTCQAVGNDYPPAQMKFLMVILAMFGVFASLATQACDDGHEHAAGICDAEHLDSYKIACHDSEGESISSLEDHLDHWSSHRHSNGSPCSCFDKSSSKSTETSIPDSSLRLPIVAVKEITSLERLDLRIPPSQAPPLAFAAEQPPFSTRISQEICVFLL